MLFVFVFSQLYKCDTTRPMDLCDDSSAKVSIYKVKHWAHDGNKVFVFVGSQSEEIKRILDKPQWTALEKRKLETRFGKDFEDLLGDLQGDTTSMVYKTLRYDDNISIVRKKIATWLFPENNGLYLWVDRDVSKSEHWIPSLAVQIMQGKRTISSAYLKDVIRNIHGHGHGQEEEASAASTDLTFEDVKAELARIKKHMPYALEVKRTIDGYMSYEFANPIATELTNQDEMHVSFESGNLLEQYAIVGNTINVVTKMDVGKKAWTAYFVPTQPASSKEMMMITNSENICDKYNDLLPSIKKASGTAECHVGFMHIRFNENITNVNIPLSEIFNRFETNEMMPFIKHNLGGATGQKNYKLRTEDLLSIKPSFIEDWTETSEKRARSSKTEYIMVVGAYKGIGTDIHYLTFLLFNDYHVDVKFSNIRTFDITIDELSTNGLGCVNAIVSRIRKITPEFGNQFERVNEASWSDAGSNVRLVNLITNMRFETVASNPKVNDIKSLASRMYPFVSVDNDNNHDKQVLLSYKRISNFANASNIVMYLNKHYRLSAVDLISDLEKIFGLTHAAATTEVEKWQKSSKMSYYQVGARSFLRPKDYNGITIKMTRSNNGYTANIEGVTHVDYQRRIASFIKYLVLYSDSKSITDLFTGENQGDVYDKAAYNDSEESDDDHFSVNDARSVVDEFMDDLDDLEGGDDDWNIDIDLSAPDAGDNGDAGDAGDNSDADSSDAEDADDSAERYVLKRLQRADKKRFRNPYSKSCQWVNRRQPIVVDDDELKLLPEGSYTNFIEYGRNERTKKKNIYICPEVWCPVSKVSMSFKQFQSNNNKCPNPNETPINFDNSYFTTKKKGVENKASRYVGFLSTRGTDTKNTEDEADETDAFGNKITECRPCCYKLPPNKTKKSKCFDAASKETGEGGEEGEDGDDGKDGVDGANPDIGDADPNATKYILGMQYPLNPKRLGILPTQFSDVFGAMVCGSGSMSTGFVTDDTDCFLRSGVDAENNGYFLACMAAILKKTKSGPIDAIIKNITVDMFITLNDGKLVGLFVDSKRSIHDQTEFLNFMKWIMSEKIQRLSFDSSKTKMIMDVGVKAAMQFSQVPETWRTSMLRIYLIYNAFTSFIAYLEDPSTSKSDAVLWDLCNRQTNWLNPLGINIVIIEVVGDSAYIICNYSRDYVRPYHSYAFVLKQGSNVYEPVVRVVANISQMQTIFKIGDHPVIDDIISKYSQSCGMDRNAIKQADAPTILRFLRYWMKQQVRFQVLDYDLKLVGFVLSTTKKLPSVYVPLSSKQSPIMSPEIACIYVDEIVKYVSDITDWEAVVSMFEKLYELTKDTTYKFQALHKDDAVIGLKNAADNVVPLMPSAFQKMLYLDNLNIFIGLQHPDERTKFVNSQYEKEAIFQALKTHVLSEVTKTPSLKAILNEKDIGVLGSHVRELISNIAVEDSGDGDGGEGGNASDSGGNASDSVSRCASISQPDICQGECIWHAQKCKIKVKHGLLKRFTGRLIDMLMKGKDLLIDPVGKHYSQSPGEIRFDQTDVNNGVLAERLEQQRAPYAFLDRVLENFVDEQVKLYPLQVGLFTEVWEDLPSPFNTASCKNIRSMFKKNETLEPQQEQIVRLADKISIAKNFGLRFDKPMLAKLGKDAYIALERTYKSTEKFIDTCKGENGSLNSMLSTITKPTLDDVLQCLDKTRYWPSDRELKTIAELLNVTFYVLGRKTLRNPNSYQIISPTGIQLSVRIKLPSKCTDYVFLWKTEEKSGKKTTHDSYQIISNPQSKTLIWNQTELVGVMQELDAIHQR